MPERVWADVPVPSRKTTSRPAIGTSPSSRRRADKVTGWALEMSVGPVYARAVCSLVTVYVAVPVVGRCCASPAKETWIGYVPAASVGMMEQLAKPLASVIPTQDSAAMEKLTGAPAMGALVTPSVRT